MALVLSAVGQQSTLLISFVTIAIISRLLTPEEYGVFAIASTLTLVATELRSFGINQFLVREPKLDQSHLGTALGMMMVLCWSLAALLALSTPSIVDFYDKPGLRPVLLIIAASFLLAPAATVQFAFLLREMRFGAILRIRIATSMSVALTSIGLVLAGWSYVGLAMGTLVGSVVELVSITIATRKENLLVRPSLSRWREMAGFGVVTTGAGLMSRASRGAPDLIIGKIGTMAAVGLFSRGLGLMAFLEKLILKAVRPIILPHLSAVKRGGGNVGEAYLQCVRLYGAVAVPLFALAALLSAELIVLFFGDQWAPAAPVASVLAGAAILQSVHAFLGAALIAVSCERLMLVKEGVLLVARYLAVALSAPSGIEAVAAALTLSSVVDVVLCTVLASRSLGLPATRIARAALHNAALALPCWLAGLVALRYGPEEGRLLERILVASATTGFVWLIAARLLRHEIWNVVADVGGDALARLRSGWRTDGG